MEVDLKTPTKRNHDGAWIVLRPDDFIAPFDMQTVFEDDLCIYHMGDTNIFSTLGVLICTGGYPSMRRGARSQACTTCGIGDCNVEHVLEARSTVSKHI